MDYGQQLEKIAKNKCRITWEDEETNERVRSIVENAVPYLHHKLGMSGEVSPDIPNL